MLGHVADLILEVTDKKEKNKAEKAAEERKQQLLHNVPGEDAVEVDEHVFVDYPILTLTTRVPDNASWRPLLKMNMKNGASGIVAIKKSARMKLLPRKTGSP